MQSSLSSRPVIFITGLIYALLGLALACAGAWLAALGGSLYYVVAGLGILVSGVLLIAATSRGAVGLCRRADRHADLGRSRNRF